MFKFPHTRYVTTLVAGKQSPEAILEDLKKVDLNFPLPGVQEIYEDLKSQQPDYFKSSKASIELAWLEEWDIKEMYGFRFDVYTSDTNTRDIEGAFKILNDPLMKRLVTSLAIANITTEDIELVVNGKYNIEYSHEHIRLFLKYFFDVQQYSFAEKKTLVEKVVDPDTKRFFTIALKGDKDYLLWKLGAAPDKSFDAMLRDMMSDSYYNFKERSRVDPDLAQRWGGLAVKLSDRIDRIAGEKTSSEDFFEELEFKLEETRKEEQSMVHIDELKEREQPKRKEKK
jgi:hypothetical protein